MIDLEDKVAAGQRGREVRMEIFCPCSCGDEDGGEK